MNEMFGYICCTIALIAFIFYISYVIIQINKDKKFQKELYSDLERITKQNKEDIKMPRFLVEQPNGKFMIWSTVVDGPIAYNLTKEDCIDFKIAEVVKLAKALFDHKKFVNDLNPYIDVSNLDEEAKEELYDILIDCGYPKEIVEEWIFSDKGDVIL
jgi:hypothetical protein